MKMVAEKEEKKKCRSVRVVAKKRTRADYADRSINDVFHLEHFCAVKCTSDKKFPDSDVVPFLFSTTVSRSSALFRSFFSSFFIVSRI